MKYRSDYSKMTEYNRNKKKTDEAWSRLYSRFDKEGLLQENSVVIPAKRNKQYVLAWSGVAAAILIGLVYVSVVWVWAPHKSGMEKELLMAHNVEASTLVTTLEDGSVVYLSKQSTLKYPEHFKVDRREVKLKGEAYFDVARKTKQTFFIDTEKVKIEVLGTAFNVRALDNASFNLAVQRGKVRVTLKQSGQVIYVGAGKAVALHADRLLLSRSGVHDLLSRYTENIRFKDESLENVLRVLNMATPLLKVQTASADLGKRKLTVEFSGNSPESAAELICLALNLKCNREGDKLILSE